MLVLGSHDTYIYMYTVSNGDYQKKTAVKKHSSYITHIDFSKDGANLHSNCGAYELLFWDCGSGKQLPGGATQFKDEDWATWTATLGWPVIYIVNIIFLNNKFIGTRHLA